MTRTSKSQRTGRPPHRDGVGSEQSATTPKITVPTRDRIAAWKANSDLALSVASLLGVAFAVIGVVLAFLGSVAHRRWHSVLSIDAGMFPQPFDAAVVDGIYSVQQSLALVPSVLGELRPSAWVAIYLASGAVVTYAMTRHWRSGAAAWTRTIFLVAGAGVLMLFALWTSIAVTRRVAEVGVNEQVIAAKAIRLIQGTAGGCPEGLSRRFHCVTFWRGDQMVASGIVISASTQRAVVIDPTVGAPRVLDLDGLEVRGRLP